MTKGEKGGKIGKLSSERNKRMTERRAAVREGCEREDGADETKRYVNIASGIKGSKKMQKTSKKF